VDFADLEFVFKKNLVLMRFFNMMNANDGIFMPGTLPNACLHTACKKNNNKFKYISFQTNIFTWY